MKLVSNKIKFILTIVLFIVGLFFVLFFSQPTVEAQEAPKPSNVESPELKKAKAKCEQAGIEALGRAQAVVKLGICVDEGATIDCSGLLGGQITAQDAQLQAELDCIAETEAGGAEFTKHSDWERYKEGNLRDKYWREVKKNIAGAFKSGLSLFAKNLAHDTAVWLASGGKGQQPLFITEGWGKYLANLTDSAVGDVLDKFMTNQLGVDICYPNFQVKLAMILGINYREPPEARCTFSKIVNNWEEAIDNADFVFELQTHLRPFENEMGVYFLTQSEIAEKVGDIARTEYEPALSNEGFQPVKSKIGEVLTPGTMVRQWAYENANVRNLNVANTIYTDTVFDFVETFANTLTAKMLQRFSGGLFSQDTSYSSFGGYKNYLYDPESSSSSGKRDAQERYANFLEGEFRVGGAYDILSKLVVCSNINNPGPTECVIDQKLLTAIKDKHLVSQLSHDVLNRPFAPSDERKNPQEVFTLRNIIILRKYRIVPVGWEIAARYISQNGGSYTLADMLRLFDEEGSFFKDLMDPAWVLKAPEMFCRREGYGADLQAGQSTIINREEYCADEQQCIKEDDDGNCLAFGYCTEEKFTWNFQGEKCQPKFNTCQTFNTVDSGKKSYLLNTLDYGNCGMEQAGCLWYSSSFNPYNGYWRHISPERVVGSCNNLNGCGISAGAGDWIVSQWERVSDNGRLIMDEACLDEGGCSFAGSSCSVGYGAMACRINDRQVWLNMPIETETDKEIYFDRDVEACDQSAVGCSQFVRLKPGLGSNLLVNPGFEYAQGNDIIGWSLIAGEADISQFEALSYGDSFSLRMEGSGQNIYALDRNVSVAVKTGEKYILSGYVFSDSENADIYFDIPGLGESVRTQFYDIEDVGNWQRLSVAFVPRADRNITPRLILESSQENAVAFFDNIQLENVIYNASNPSAYSHYNPFSRPDGQMAYLKKAPDYYDCYLTDSEEWPADSWQLNQVLDSSMAACSSYAGVCIEEEVGCEAYTLAGGEGVVPAIVSPEDTCPSVCEGYQLYKREATDFVSATYKSFIADNTLRYCSADNVGCDEFTNLDEVSEGGELKEYYSQIKACQKPDMGDGVTFYTWEGSDTTGYQLKEFNLKASQSESIDPNAPCVNLSYYRLGETGVDQGQNYCSDPTATSVLPSLVGDAISNSPATNLSSYLNYINNNQIKDSAIINQSVVDELHTLGVCVKQEINGYFNYDDNGTPDDLSDDNIVSILANPDCREFYDTGGNVSYRLMSKTITVSDDCHPYRRTQTQTNDSEVEKDCNDSGGYYNQYGECVYMAIPGEGKSCKTKYAGCRQYSGNQSGDIRMIFNDTFTDNNGGWNSGSYSQSATYPGGQSWNLNGQMIKQLDNIGRNKTYILSFWAKGDGEFLLGDVYFQGASKNEGQYFSDPTDASAQIKIKDQWRKYELGPVYTTWIEDNSVDFVFNSAGNIYLDNIILQEVKDSVYAVENSWFTPYACDNIADSPYGVGGQADPTRDNPGEMLGCRAYNDRDGNNIYLRSFTSLCRDDAVGCEALIDTKNTASPYYSDYNTTNDTLKDDIFVSADEIIYMVNDRQYSCQSEDYGCSAYGLPEINNRDEVVGYDTVYLKNRPDDYNNTLCSFNSLWCQEFKSDNSVIYFKDPRGKECEYKSLSGQLDKKWYKKGSEEECDTDPYQTIGTGGLKNKLQPLGWYDNKSSVPNSQYNGWVGLCPSSQSGCSEYVDPLAEIYATELFNGDFSRIVNGLPAGWRQSQEDGMLVYSQDINLQNHTLYSLAAEYKDDIKVRVQCDSATDMWSPDKSMINIEDNVMEMSATGEGNISGRIYVSNPSNCMVKTYAVYGEDILNIQMSESGVYYYKNTVGKDSCNGLVDYAGGCVLLNDRSEINYNQPDPFKRFRDDYLVYDADIIYNGDQPASPSLVNNKSATDSNLLLKVEPDRQCASWLYCATYEKNSDALSGSNMTPQDSCLSLGLCSSLNEQGECENIINIDDDYGDTYSISKKNITGYAMLGKEDADGSKAVEGYLPYDKMKQAGETANVANGSFESVLGDTAEPLAWYLFNDPLRSGWKDYKYLVDEASDKRKDGVRYLRLNAGYMTISDYIDVNPNTVYNLSLWLQTLDLQPKNASATVWYRLYDKSSRPIGDNWVYLARQDAGLNWAYLTSEIITTSNADRLKIVLANRQANSNNYFNVPYSSFSANDSNVSGFSLYDGIDMKPVLQVYKDEDKNDIARSCRLYPQSDSLSCQYYGYDKLYYGWKGYCLVKDPDNSDICLQWWPVDSIKGEVLDEISGYDNKVPLYYCLESSIDLGINSKNWDDWQLISGKESENKNINIDTLEVSSFLKQGEEEIIDLLSQGRLIYNDPNSVDLRLREQGGTDEVYSLSWHFYGDTSSTWSVEMEGLVPDREITINFDDPDNTNGFDPNMFVDKIKIKCVAKAHQGGCEQALSIRHVGSVPYCNNVTKVVGEIGTAKAWNSRLKQGSGYEYKSQDILDSNVYETTYLPFGSIKSPSPVNNPWIWDSLNALNMGSPMKFNSEDDRLVAQNFGRCLSSRNICSVDSHLMPCEEKDLCKTDAYINDSVSGVEILKSLFVEHYGIWNWDTDNQVWQENSAPVDWSIPDDICPYQLRPADSDDYCFIKPVVTNVNLNPENLTDGGGIARLRFNIEVDPDQLPLTGYTVDWGDGEVNSVSGASIRARTNEDNSFELYHYYDYWTLRDRGCPGSSGLCSANITVFAKDNWNKVSDPVSIPITVSQ